MINKYEFKNFKGYFYVEKPNNQEENGRCKIYDENKRYLDYITCYYCETDFKLTDSYKNYERIIAKIQNALDEFDVFEMFCESYDYGTTPQEIMENYCDDISVNGNEEEIEEVSSIIKDMCTMNDKQLCDEYDINKIGNYYFRGNW